MKAIQQHYPAAGMYTANKKSIVSRFLGWCESQEQYRLGWLAAIIAGHGCAITPLTLIAVILSGNSILFWFMAMASMGTALVTNLAALPAKITIPVFFASIAVDVFIVANCFAAGFNIAAINQ